MSRSYTKRLDAVFFDYEGTLNDSLQSGSLYAAGLSGYLARRFPDRQATNYGRAVAAAMNATRHLPEQFAGSQEDWPGYAEYRRRELRLWLETLLGVAGLPVPAGAEALDAFAADLVSNVVPSFVPTRGAVEAVRSLSETGLRLYVSSGATTEYTARCLRDAGLLELFAEVFGPDKLDTLKTGTGYYAKCFGATGVDPARVCIVDDSPGPLRWALQLGARAIGVGVELEHVLGREPCTTCPDFKVVAHLGELTATLSKFNV